MNSEAFLGFYKKEENDETVTPLTDAIGFTVIRNYKNSSDHYKNGLKMLIRLYNVDGFVRGGISMVQSTKPDGTYIEIDSDNKYINNLAFGREEELSLNTKTGTIYTSKKREISVNELVNTLVGYHLSKRLHLSRVINNSLVTLTLTFLFWVSNHHYDAIKTILAIRSVNNKYEDSKGEPEPFFKYFRINKNLLLVSVVILVIIISLLRISSSASYTLSNPSVLLLIFAMLFILEKISIKLSESINGFLDGQRNCMYKLFNRRYGFNFKLKFSNHRR